MQKNLIHFQYDSIKLSQNKQKAISSVFVSVVSIFIATLLAVFVAAGIYQEESYLWEVFRSIFTAPFRDLYWINTLFIGFCIFVVAGIAFIIPYRAGLFNIGVSGQMMFGAIVAYLIANQMCYIDADGVIQTNVYTGFGQIIILIISMLSAGFVGALIGLLKAKFNMNEVVSSIMLNWIIYFLGTLMIKEFGTIAASGINTESLPKEFLLALGTPVNGSTLAMIPALIITFIVVLLTYFGLKYTVLGQKIINTGLSQTGSLYAGYSVKKNIVLTMFLSGVVSGILGALVYMAQKTGSFDANVGAKSIPIEGFNGISVGLIGMINPIGILPVAFYFSLIDTSSTNLQSLGIDPSIKNVMFGIVVYGAAIIGVLYLINPKMWFIYLFKNKRFYMEWKEIKKQYLINNNEANEAIQHNKKLLKIYKLIQKKHAYANKIKQHESFINQKVLANEDLMKQLRDVLVDQTNLLEQNQNQAKQKIKQIIKTIYINKKQIIKAKVKKAYAIKAFNKLGLMINYRAVKQNAFIKHEIAKELIERQDLNLAYVCLRVVFKNYFLIKKQMSQTKLKAHHCLNEKVTELFVIDQKIASAYEFYQNQIDLLINKKTEINIKRASALIEKNIKKGLIMVGSFDDDHQNLSSVNEYKTKRDQILINYFNQKKIIKAQLKTLWKGNK